MSNPVVYVYPQSKKRFSKLYKFEAFIVSRLQHGSGLYHHTDARELPAGSVVLFLYDKRIIGDGVVVTAETRFSEEGYEDWPFRIRFASRLVRLFPHYVHLSELSNVGEFEAYRRFERRTGKRRGWPLRSATPISAESYLAILQKTTL